MLYLQHTYHALATCALHNLGILVMQFGDQVDLESLMMAGKLNILVVGQDVLTHNGEVVDT